MYYTINISPSTENELVTFQAEKNKNKVKTLEEKKLKLLYQTAFVKAVKQYNNTTVSGQRIDDYFESLKKSNVPVVYTLNISIYFDNDETPAMKKNVASLFSKMLGVVKKDKQFTIVGAYTYSVENVETLTIYFFPISTGYQSGLMMRSDLIDVVIKMCGLSQDARILEALKALTTYWEAEWKSVSGNMLSQEEMEGRKEEIDENELALQVHHVEAQQLKDYLVAYQTRQAENAAIERQISDESERIINEEAWVLKKAEEIKEAEEVRLRLIEEERALRRQREEEEARLAAEEAKRLEEIQRAAAEEAKRVKVDTPAPVTSSMPKAPNVVAVTKDMEVNDFAEQIKRHMAWMKENNIDGTRKPKSLPVDVMEDERRLVLRNARISGFVCAQHLILTGVEFYECKFIGCKFMFTLKDATVSRCVFQKCGFMSSHLVDSNIEYSRFEVSKADELVIDGSVIINCFARKFIFSDARFAPATGLINIDFSQAEFLNCDIKSCAFLRCDLRESVFKECDLRGSAFQRCYTQNMDKSTSMS